MKTGSRIASARAREILTARGHPGIEATVVTENGGGEWPSPSPGHRSVNTKSSSPTTADQDSGARAS